MQAGCEQGEMLCLWASQAGECSSAKGHSCMSTVTSAGPALSDPAFSVTAGWGILCEGKRTRSWLCQSAAGAGGSKIS